MASYAVGGAQRKTDMGAGQVGGGKLEVASQLPAPEARGLRGD